MGDAFGDTLIQNLPECVGNMTLRKTRRLYNFGYREWAIKVGFDEGHCFDDDFLVLILLHFNGTPVGNQRDRPIVPKITYIVLKRKYRYDMQEISYDESELRLGFCGSTLSRINAIN